MRPLRFWYNSPLLSSALGQPFLSPLPSYLRAVLGGRVQGP
jgi:hypothetical protein